VVSKYQALLQTSFMSLEASGHVLQWLLYLFTELTQKDPPTLLRYNLHTTKLNSFKCTFQWFSFFAVLIFINF
jgi:hypothetical protein